MESRRLAIEMLNDGFSQRKVALLLKCSHGAIQKVLKKYQNTKSLENLQKSGRPVKTTARERRALTKLCKKDPLKSARELQSECFPEKNVSISTIKRILRKYNLFGRKAARKPFLSMVHKKHRLLWCKNYANWTANQWNNAIYTDECQILLQPVKKVYVRRPKNARYIEKYITKTFKHGLQSIMIWGAIRSDGSRVLVKCPKKVDAAAYKEILKRSFIPLCKKDDFIIQDNAPIHKAKESLKFIEDNKICYMSDWPSQSPDLNIIENMWSVLKRNLWRCHPKNIDELWIACQKEWSLIPNSYVKTLFSSIPSRLAAVIKSKGSNCKY